MRKIAAMAVVYDIAVAPHSAADPVGIAAALHAMAATPNFLIQEFGGGAGADLFVTPLRMEAGYLLLPEGPGLGVEISPEGLEAQTFRGAWPLRPMRRHPEDGAYSDI